MTVSQSAYRVALLNLLTALVPTAEIVEGKLVGGFDATELQNVFGQIGMPGSGVTADQFNGIVLRVFHSTSSGTLDVGTLLSKLVGVTNGTVTLRIVDGKYAIMNN